MKVLLIGGSGQLGFAIRQYSPVNVNLLIPTKKELNLIDKDNCHEYVLKNKPNWVINSGAYTNVDKAESEKELVLRINAEAPEVLAKALLKTNGKLLQISTDYVFDGNQSVPYRTDQNYSPINFYGKSKANAEEMLSEILSKENQLCILRTSWLMSSIGNNFANKILKLLEERKEIKVVYDQVGSPTSIHSLAKVIWRTIEINNTFSLKGKIFPKILQFSDDGIASWYDVAVAIDEIGKEIGLINKSANILPIESISYKTAALRPSYSVLDTNPTKEILGIKGIHWKKSLLHILNTKLNS